MIYDLGKFKLQILFEVHQDKLNKDFKTKSDGDWDVLNGGLFYGSQEEALNQDLEKSYSLSPFDDPIDIEQGNELDRFKNANMDSNTILELKNEVRNWLSKHEEINLNTLEISIVSTE